AETDFFHAFGSEEDGARSGKTEVKGNERDLGVSFVAVFFLYCQIALIPLNLCFTATVPVFFASESMKKIRFSCLW
ncbi:hypothetical protein, partial [Escherichia coli]|uniref:hypothetical protein n=1 Tax=Escherichia coli TaxID=562 RepID=UPI002FBD6CFC